jgi:hypothetical protein
MINFTTVSTMIRVTSAAPIEVSQRATILGEEANVLNIKLVKLHFSEPEAPKNGE